MRRTFIVSLMLLCVSLISAQTDSLQVEQNNFNLKSKRGFYYFPQKGDWSISIDATPFFSYLGSMIGNKTVAVYNYSYSDYYSSSYSYSSNETPSFAFTAQNPGTFFIKHFKEDNVAYRFKLMFGYTSSKDLLGSGTDDDDEIYFTQTALALGFALGQEYYLPIKSRIRGYYGYEVGFAFTPYEGTLFTDDSYEVIGNVEYVNSGSESSEYKEVGGGTFGLNAIGILGVEWFFAPKISLGGEFGLGVAFNKMAERKYEPATTDIIIDKGSQSFGFVPVASGDLVLHIYF